ncbi:MAG: phosphoglycerate kinase [Candidatus Nanosyncoccaceae bacterium]|jgi:3-phosphoglycerate kinase
MIKYQKASIEDVDVTGRVVLLRVDFNVPILNGAITDDSRIIASLPTIRDLIGREVKQVIVLSHLGRPEGPEEAFSLKPIRERLEGLLGLPVGFDEPTEAFSRMDQVVLCENLRFWKGEEKNNQDFAQNLIKATKADLFVQDGFSVCHRTTATTEVITRLLPSYASAGLIQEYEAINQFIEDAPRPLVAVLGGAKISDKIDFVKRMVELADQVFVGGALGTTFLRANGKPVGSSLVEYDQEKVVEEINQLVKAERKALFLPTDVKVAPDELAGAYENKLVEAVLGQDKILDIGDSSTMVLGQLMANAGAVIWNGPLGYVENPTFEAGSEVIVRSLSALEKPALIGGGDTLAFIKREQPNLDYDGLVLSTGGGAMLELIASGRLVGVDCLLDA